MSVQHSLPTQELSDEREELAEHESLATINPRVEETTQKHHPVGFVQARNRVLEYRAWVGKGRMALQRRRHGLRQLRQQTSKLEATFASTIEKLAVQRDVDNEPSLRMLSKEVREIRDKIVSEESAYDKEEDAVAAAEYHLEAEENRFYQAYEMNSAPNGSYPSEPIHMPPSPEITPQIASFPKTSDPLDEYHTKVGQATILRESLDELNFEREEYLGKKRCLDLRGVPMDPDELEFLDTFKETFDKTLKELQVVEDEISKLELAAIDTGLLSPSAIYKPHLAAPSPLEQLQGGLTAEPEFDSVSTMFIDLQGLGGTDLDPANFEPVIASPSTGPSGAYMDRWLNSLPGLTQQALETAGKFTTQEGSRLIQYCHDQLFRPRKRATSTKSVPRQSRLPGFPGSDQLRTGWVIVDPNTRPRPLSDDDINRFSRSQNIEGTVSRHPQAYSAVLERFPGLDIASPAIDVVRGGPSKMRGEGHAAPLFDFP
jgi:hypothetical protein